MTDPLERILSIVQRDPCHRGLQRDPSENLVTATVGDFKDACRAIVDQPTPRIGIVTGFTIPSAEPPCGETDGPLGALYLARSMLPLGMTVEIASDGTTLPALRAGVAATGLNISVRELDHSSQVWADSCDFLIALERVGPSRLDGRCYSMSGRDMTGLMQPAHELFESSRRYTTIGIGDGGNEIGMGKVSWDNIRKNITNGERIACSVATDHLIVAGISNWGAYALAAAIRHQCGTPFESALFELNMEQRLLEVMVESGPLVDGVTLQHAATVDGLTFEDYAGVLSEISEIVKQ